ncbi:MAG TPA: PQQ-dependent sugar dehydrogenase [Pyrinomonadaceae bacterium]|jgi:glucose/arabinose dehydrogenase
MSRRVLVASLFAAALACCLTSFPLNPESFKASAQGGAPPTLTLGAPLGGFSSPVGVTHAGDGSGRIFVVEQGGRIRLVKDGALQAAPFLDIASRISTGGERGLLGLAFPPDYARKGHFYVNYTDRAGDTVVARFRRSAGDPDAADPLSEQILLTVAQPFANHNGGQLAFSQRDKFLYVGLGDGGSGGDPGNRAQNPAELLGKILRLDTETGRPFTYTVPASNPFVAAAGFRPEIWALGLRNPWRFSFDRLTADLYVADVGQESFEEVNFQPAASPGGENYGWRIMEGAHCFNPNPCNQAGLTLPVVELSSQTGSGNCSVTGGYVYRAGAFPRMQGLYLYGDFCSGRIWGLRRESGAWQNTLLLDTSLQISAFGEDEAGAVYVASYGTGQIYPLVDAGQTPAATPTPAPAEIKFSSASFVTFENLGAAELGVTRSGDTSTEIFVDYATTDATATSRSDYTTARGTLRFAPGETMKIFRVFVTDDQTQEGEEFFDVRLSNVVGPGVLEAVPSRRVTVFDNDSSTSPTNPLDRSDFFVRQHYLDFLSREADADGLQFWVNEIESCGADAACREVKRVNVSAAFFLSIEFQETGYLVYRLHKAAFGDVAGTPTPIRLNDFLRDTQEIGRNVVVGQGDWRGLLEANKRAFANAFVERAAFVSRYPTGQTPAQFVAALDANAGDVLTPAEEADLAARLADGRETRASALRRVAEDEDFKRAEFNRAFVLMQYFGYLRRNPDDAPDTNFNGYNFWLTKLNSFGGDFQAAEMVKAFISSDEYRNRFRQ